MPRFVMIGYDGPNGAALRKLHRPAHIEGIEALDAQGRIVHAGPLLAENERPLGSVILFEAQDLASARAIAAQDPYVVQGIFDRYEVYETKIVFPK